MNINNISGTADKYWYQLKACFKYASSMSTATVQPSEKAAKARMFQRITMTAIRWGTNHWSNMASKMEVKNGDDGSIR